MVIKALVTNSSEKERENIVKALMELGVPTVFEAKDSKEAIVFLQKSNFDLIVTEGSAQCCESEEFWKAAHKSDNKVPVIVTAPQSKRLDELQKAYPEATNYLAMPFTKERFQKTVGEYFPSLAG